MNYYEILSKASKLAGRGLDNMGVDRNSYTRSLIDAIGLYGELAPRGYNDKYKHALINCILTQNGEKGEKTASLLSGLREVSDVLLNENTPKHSDEDTEANIYGRNTGRENKDKDCREMVKNRYKP